jgi:hypothetical protein
LTLSSAYYADGQLQESFMDESEAFEADAPELEVVQPGESLWLEPVGMTADGMPRASVMKWCFEPGRARSMELSPSLTEARGTDRGGIDDGPGPVDLVGCT